MNDFLHEIEVIEHMLDELGVTDDYLPPDIVECGCEAVEGSMHLAWHLEERVRKLTDSGTGDRESP